MQAVRIVKDDNATVEGKKTKTFAIPSTLARWFVSPLTLPYAPPPKLIRVNLNPHPFFLSYVLFLGLPR